MTKNPAKDFGPIAADYAFFEEHSTEAAQDSGAYLAQLRQSAPSAGPIRMLDFGCGSGTFTARLLKQVSWPPERLELSLLEPVEAARRQAVARVAGFTQRPVTELATLPVGLSARFDIVIANHVFYYVADLKDQLQRLVNTLAPTGMFLTAIAGQTNALIEFWVVGFGLLSKNIPYNMSEDVEQALDQLGADYQKQPIPYELTFPDSEENRMKIVRFLMANHLEQMPQRPLLDLFDKHAHDDRIVIRTSCDHFTIR